MVYGVSSLLSSSSSSPTTFIALILSSMCCGKSFDVSPYDWVRTHKFFWFFSTTFLSKLFQMNKYHRKTLKKFKYKSIIKQYWSISEKEGREIKADETKSDLAFVRPANFDSFHIYVCCLLWQQFPQIR